MEISLESVLRKASRLEDSLRSCKTRALLPDPVKSRPTVATTPPPLSSRHRARYSSSPPPSSTELAGEWQKLTAYIVSLEKEVQYYKQLAQDVQNTSSKTNSASTPARDSPAGVLTTPQAGPPSLQYWKEYLDTDPESRALLLVFNYLSVPELHHAALVCRKWYRLSRHPQLWKEVIMSDIMVAPEVSLVQTYTQVSYFGGSTNQWKFVTIYKVPVFLNILYHAYLTNLRCCSVWLNGAAVQRG